MATVEEDPEGPTYYLYKKNRSDGLVEWIAICACAEFKTGGLHRDHVIEWIDEHLRTHGS